MNVPETFFSVREQLILFGLSIAGGAVMGLLYDLFRIIRTVFHHNSVLVAAEDVVFLISWAIFLIAFAGAAARGEFRFYYVIGSLIGFALYIATVGSAVICTVRKLCTVISAVLRFIMRPFVKIYVFLCKKYTVKFVGSSKVIVNFIKKIIKVLQKPAVMVYNKKANKSGKNVKRIGKTEKRQAAKKKRSV